MAHIEWFTEKTHPYGLYSLNTKWDEPIWSAVTQEVIGVVRRSSAEDNEEFNLSKEHEKFLMDWLASRRKPGA